MKDAKPTPKAVIRYFLQSLQELESGFDAVVVSLAGARQKANVEIIVAEQFATSTAILWEGFVHDILIAYVLKHHKKSLKTLQKRVIRLVNDKFGHECGKRIVFTFGTPSAVSDIEPLLDPKGWNIAANSGDQLAKVANDFLKSSVARKFSLDKEDRAFIDLLVALRNFLAHRSTGGRKSLIAAIRKMELGGKNAGLNSPSINLKRFLLQPGPPAANKLKFILERVKIIAQSFA
jgi:hypothetical protein